MQKEIDDEKILISDQFFNKTLKNLQAQSSGSNYDRDKLEGYQIKRNRDHRTSGKRFQETAKWIDDIGKKLNLPLKSKGAVMININEIYNVSPVPNAQPGLPNFLMRRKSSKMKISVASGKGGTGKTTIAINLALTLQDVQYIDCDVEEPNGHIFLKPRIEETMSVGIPVPQG